MGQGPYRPRGLPEHTLSSANRAAPFSGTEEVGLLRQGDLVEKGCLGLWAEEQVAVPGPWRNQACPLP